ncbi:hypothetical protein [Streptomyces sp. TRM49041]|uniref:hypothetical protein n=1 Tax=Streptomyces sp. TRM49041 TaxID=2603216 RepID=UPI0011ECA780|nr:hypothetical protein [Streptomyces sp. TRM49041]
MPRGRHRHSPPLHRLLPPSAVAGASVLCAGGAWLLADPLGLRLLVAATAAAAVTGAVLMRAWDRTAGRRVAELTRARASDQWKTEERIAELEADLDEARELRVKLDAKLRAKRVELAGLRNEHAELLRRYATAETERASALEGRRQLALGAASPAGPDAGSASGTSAAARALTAGSSAPTPDDYLRAAQALRRLTHNAVTQEARRIAEAALGPTSGAAGTTGTTGTAALAVRPVPAAAAIVPYSSQRRPVPRPEGSFDFFGTQKGAQKEESGGKKPAAAIEAAVQEEDLADVVGEEALAAEKPDGRRGPGQAVGKVIDLTAHDETEQLDVVELRDVVSS